MPRRRTLPTGSQNCSQKTRRTYASVSRRNLIGRVSGGFRFDRMQRLSGRPACCVCASDRCNAVSRLCVVLPSRRGGTRESALIRVALELFVRIPRPMQQTVPKKSRVLRHRGKSSRTFDRRPFRELTDPGPSVTVLRGNPHQTGGAASWLGPILPSITAFEITKHRGVRWPKVRSSPRS